MENKYLKKLREDLDLGLNEKFELLNGHGLQCEYSPYKFIEGGIIDKNGAGISLKDSYDIYNLFMGIYTIRKLPLQIEHGEPIYHVTPSGDISNTVFNGKLIKENDIIIGYCFPRTKEGKLLAQEKAAKLKEKEILNSKLYTLCVTYHSLMSTYSDSFYEREVKAYEKLKKELIALINKEEN